MTFRGEQFAQPNFRRDNKDKSSKEGARIFADDLKSKYQQDFDDLLKRVREAGAKGTGDKQANEGKESESVSQGTEFKSWASSGEDDLEADRKKFAKEFQQKPLNLDLSGAEGYSKDMLEKDLEYLSDWAEYTVERAAWMIRELFALSKRRIEIAKSKEDLEEIRNWTHFTKDQIYEERDRQRNEIKAQMDRVRRAYFNKIDPKMEEEIQKKRREEARQKKEEELRKKREEEQKKREAEQKRKEEEEKRKEEEKSKREEDGNKKDKKPEEGTDREKEEKIKTVETTVLHELGITYAEYKMITGRIAALSDIELGNLVKRVFKINVLDSKEVKKSYREFAKKWHADSAIDDSGKEVSELKLKIVNALYGEYSKRY